MRLLRTALIAVAALCGVGAPAFASSAFLSATVSTTAQPSGFTAAGTLANLAGANSGNNLNTTDYAEQVSSNGSNHSGTWTISAGMVVNLAGSTTFTINVWAATDDATTSATLTSLTFTDSGGHTKTVSAINLAINPAKDQKNNLFSSTATYALGGGFDPSAITSISLNIVVGTQNNGARFGLDAVQISGTSGVFTTPEPGTFALFSLGLAGLGFVVRRKSKRGARPAAKPSTA